MSFWNNAGGGFSSVTSAIKSVLDGNNQPQQQQYYEQPEVQPEVPEKEADFANLYIGLTTGKLQRRGNANGVDGGQYVYLKDNDACQNICAIGGIGSGKTTTVIQPLFWQLIRQDYERGKLGGLVFDIKGDFCDDVQALCDEAERKLIRIGVQDPGGHKRLFKTNLLKGLTPEQAAGFLKSVLFLTGGGGGNDAFFIQQSVSCIQNALGLLSCLGEEYYTLGHCYEYIFVDSYKQDIDDQIRDLMDKDPKYEVGTIDRRVLDNNNSYFINVWERMPHETQQSVAATIDNILGSFVQPALVDAFSSTEGNYDITNILNGDIVAVDMPLARWQTAGQVVYTMIKLRFFNLLQMRQFDKTLPQHAVFFLCDEYQQIISANKDGLSDLSFWDKSRSAKCIGIISTQSVSSFRSAIGNPTITDTILANFRQKIFFKTEDTQTIDLIHKLTGKVEIKRIQVNESSGASTAPVGGNSGWLGLFGGRTTTTNNRAVSTSTAEHDLVDANLIRQLGRLSTSQTIALGFFDIDGQSVDDCIILNPCYVNKKGAKDKNGNPLPPYNFLGVNSEIKELTGAEWDYWLNQA